MSLGRQRLLSVCLYHFHLRFYGQDCLVQYRLCACMLRGLHEYSLHCSLLAQSRVQTMWVTPMSHLLEKGFTPSQLQDASLEWGQGFTRHPTSPINTAGLICMLNFVSGGLLTYFWRFWESSPVQSSPHQSSDQWHPVLQMLLNYIVTCFSEYNFHSEEQLWR